MMRTRVKICGITRAEDALIAVREGADALGMVFYKPSPRNISVGDAAAIAAQIPAFVTLVGLFVNETKQQINAILNQLPIQVLQFHGDESPEFCQSFNMPYIKALRVGAQGSGLSGQALRKTMQSYQSAAAILLDTYQDGMPGGTGEKFDWDLIPDTEQNLILAGGLRPENVARAIGATKPYAVDVSGGVESAPGVKDADRIRAFLNASYSADRQQ